jgi:hypothetical protein
MSKPKEQPKEKSRFRVFDYSLRTSTRLPLPRS